MAKRVVIKLALDFRQFFKKEADKNIIGSENTPYPTYRSLVARMKKGVELDKAPDNKPDTIRQKV